MREALAAADNDFILSEPRGRPRRAARRPSRRPKESNRIGAYLVGALCVAALGGILANALIFQKARHPAPLFAGQVRDKGVDLPLPQPRPPSPAAREAEPPVVRTAPEERPAPRSRAGAPESPPAASPTSPPAVEARPHDPISELILNGSTRDTQPAVSKSVLAAQKALVKLGYVLKADGLMGASTRQAIERYERDRGRAPKGVLTPSVLRSLSAESGVPAE